MEQQLSIANGADPCSNHLGTEGSGRAKQWELKLAASLPDAQTKHTTKPDYEFEDVLFIILE